VCLKFNLGWTLDTINGSRRSGQWSEVEDD
jgi:hypothetical protein